MWGADKTNDQDAAKDIEKRAQLRQAQEENALRQRANAANAARKGEDRGFFWRLKPFNWRSGKKSNAAEERGWFSSNNEPADDRRGKFTDRFAGIETEATVEKKTEDARKIDTNWFGEKEKKADADENKSWFGGKDKKNEESKGWFGRKSKPTKKEEIEEEIVLVEPKEEPGLFGKKEESGLFGRKKEPGLFGEKEESGLFGKKKKSGLFGEKEESGLFGKKKEPGLFGEKEESGFFRKKKEPGLFEEKEESGFFSGWGKSKKGKEKPGMFDRIFGTDEERKPEPVDKPAMFSNAPPEAPPQEKKPGFFDRMLGRDKKKDDPEPDKKSGFFGGLMGRRARVPEPAERRGGIFGDAPPSGTKDQKVIIEKETVPEERKGGNWLPSLPSQFGKGSEKVVKKKRVVRQISNVSMKTVVMIPLLVLTLLVAFLSYKYMKAKENSLGSGMSGGGVAEYLDYAFPTQSDWCGHPVKKAKSSRLQPAPLAALIVTNTTVFSNVGDEYDKMIKIFPELLISNQTNHPSQTALIICSTEPTFVLSIDLTNFIVELKSLKEPCAASSDFRDAVEDALDREAEASFNLTSQSGSESIPFAVTVNIRDMRAEFVLCKDGPDGCLDPIDFVKASFDKLNVKKGITDFALVYSDNANTFQSDPKYICEVSQTEIQMCWNPKTYAPVRCFKP